MRTPIGPRGRSTGRRHLRRAPPARPAAGDRRPARKPAKNRAEKSEARRQAIVTAALDEFCARGFAATRLDDVAARAGVAKGTIYLHFEDKENLFQELVRARMVPVVGTLEAAFRTDLPLRVVVERAVDIFVRDIYETPRKQVMRLIISEG